MNVYSAVVKVLQEAGKSLHVNEITKRIMDVGYWKSNGKTPEATVGARLYSDIKKEGEASTFVKVSPQTFALRNATVEMSSAGSAPMLIEEAPKPSSVKTGFSFSDCAQKVLEEFGDKQPMHYKEITEKTLQKGWLVTAGKTPGDLKIAKTALAELRHMEAIKRLDKSSYPSVIEQMKRTLERQRLRILEISGSVILIQKIDGANKHWQEFIKQDSTRRIIVETAIHKSWFERIKPIQHDSSQFLQLQASVKLLLCDTSLRLTAAERFMAGIDFEAIKSRFQIEMPVTSVLESSIAHAAASYRNLAESLQEISDITRLPAFVLPGATREIYTTSFALETLRPWNERDEEEAETEIQLVAEAELETSVSIALLQQVDRRLARLCIGARNALHSNNPDRGRHILSSHRELWHHLFRRLAPDNLVVAWILGSSNQKELLHEGKPTRRARYEYVCRELKSAPLTNLLLYDNKALLQLFKLFNRIHELEIGLTDEQLRAIVCKSESSLMYILQISVKNTCR